MQTPSAVRLFYHPVLFWLGCLLVAGGVLAHMPMFMMAAPLGFKLVGMPMDTLMVVGMGVLPVALAMVAYSLIPPAILTGRSQASPLDFHVADLERLTTQHWLMIMALMVAVTVDVMKPATLGFVMPGFKAEYGLEARQASILPLFALTGTIVGSIVWGRLADYMGRRGAILLSAVMFMATAICGAMPGVGWNLLMCFLMGSSAGGMLPITFTLLAEVVPARHRGWLLVALGGFGTAIGFLVAAVAAWGLEPLYSWRSLWLLGLPTGLMVLLVHRYIPESPRYLAHIGAHDEARRVFMRYGGVEQGGPPGPETAKLPRSASYSRLLLGPYALTSFCLLGTGISWGVVNFGFLLWLPTALRAFGLDPAAASKILALSGVLALPGIFLVIPLYQRWNSVRTLAGATAALAFSLVLYSAIQFTAPDSTIGTILSVSLVLISSSGLIATLMPYASEIFPIELRATGTGMVAASSKLGGLIGALLGFVGVSAHLSLLGLILVLPLLGFAITLWRHGVNTSGLHLEDVEAKVHLRAAAS